VLGRRLLVLVLVLMGLTALAASVAPQPQPAPRPVAREPAPAPPAPAAPGSALPQAVERTLSADLGAPDQRVAARVGDTVELEVTGDVLDTVAIPALDREEAMDPLSPARFEIYADRPGTYPITLVEAKRPIGTLVVSPAG